MFYCTTCDDDVAPGRVALGYTTCLTCGAADARNLTAAMSRRCVPQGHKQGMTYVANPTVQLKQVNKVART